MSDKSKKPLYGPPQPASTSLDDQRWRQCIGQQSVVVGANVNAGRKGPSSEVVRPLAAGMWQELYRIPQNFPGSRRGRNGQLQPELETSQDTGAPRARPS